MSLVDSTGPVTEANFALGSYEKFQPGFRVEGRPKTQGSRVLVRNSRNKANMATHKKYNFRAYHSLVTPKAGITAVKWDASDVNIAAGNARRCHPGRQRSSRFHPGNRAKVMFIWQNFQPAYRDPGWKNRDLGNQASPPPHINTSKIIQRN